MAYELHVPEPPFSALVACFWNWEGAPSTPSRERLMPTGEPCIVVNLRDEAIREYPGDDPVRSQSHGLAMFSGPRTSSFLIDNQQQDRVFGIQFHAGGASPFFRMPASELEDRAVSLEYIWKHSAAELRERLLACATPREMFRVAACVLLARASASLDLHPAVRFSVRTFSDKQLASVAAVSDRTGYSQRRFTELFRQQVGLSPKAFCRVRRFQNVLQALHPAAEVDWIQVALEHGYYDQAHFIHDFRQFSGLTPSQYWQRRSLHLNHVPSPD